MFCPHPIIPLHDVPYEPIVIIRIGICYTLFELHLYVIYPFYFYGSIEISIFLRKLG